MNESPKEFTRTRPAVEGVIMRIGLNTTQVILIAGDGEWLRFVVPDIETGKTLCARLGVESHEGYPDHLRLRISSHTRSRTDWAQAPYPERYRGSSV